MKTLVQEYAEYSRTLEDDGSVRPTQDTGFRAQPAAPFIYIPRTNPLWIQLPDHVHVDDIKTRTESKSMRGIFFITIDGKAIGERVTADIARNIAVRKEREAANG